MRVSTIPWRPTATVLLVLASAFTAACGGDDSDALSADSALARDLTLLTPDSSLLVLRDSAPLAPPPTRAVAPAATRAGTPVRRPTPPPIPRPEPIPEPTPPPVEAVPAPAPAPRAMLASGTALTLAVGSQVCTTDKVGDKFMATLSEPVYGSNGASIPAGSRAVLEVASITPASDGTDAAITFRVRSLETGAGAVAPVGTATPVDGLQKVRVEGKTSDGKKVAAGAIAGAILGQMIGKDTKGTVIGAAAGAAAGTAAARMGAKYQGCLPGGSRVRLVLADELVVG
jgi:hypothetical protein